MKSANHLKHIIAHIALPWKQAGNSSLNSTQVNVPNPSAYAASYSKRLTTATILKLGTNGESFSKSNSGDTNDSGVGSIGYGGGLLGSATGASGPLIMSSLSGAVKKLIESGKIIR